MAILDLTAKFNSYQYFLLYGTVHYAMCISYMQIDILHPLTSLELKMCKTLPVDICQAQAASLDDNIYVGGGCTSSDNDAMLYVYDSRTDAWDSMTTPVYHFALTTYKSQLLLVGGKLLEDKKVTNRIWTLGEGTMPWKEELPAMLIKCHSASAIEYKDNVIVAGGAQKATQSDIDVVEVYNGHSWSYAQSLPKPCSDIKSTIYNGHWYLMGKWGSDVHYASLEEVVSYCQVANPKNIWDHKPPLPKLPINIQVVPNHSYMPFTPIMFGNRLLAIGGWKTPTSSIFAYSSRTKSWISVGCIGIENSFASCMIVLSSGELMVIGGFSDQGCYSNKVFKITLKGKK